MTEDEVQRNLDRIKDHNSRGEFFGAHDLAMRSYEQCKDQSSLNEKTREFMYLAVLSLARGQAYRQAAKLFRDLGLEKFLSISKFAKLSARLVKDQGLRESGTDRIPILRIAARKYEMEYAKTQENHPGVNAATLHLLTGNAEKAKEIAGEILPRIEKESDKTYFDLVSMAELHLVLGNPDNIEEILKSAQKAPREGLVDPLGTRRQLQILCREQGFPDTILGPFKPKNVAHFCGHRMGKTESVGRLKSGDEERVANTIRKYLEKHDIGFLYGSLASGSDIIFTETAIAMNLTVHITLPFEIESFLDRSVRDSVGEWEERFRKCLNQDNVTYSTSSMMKTVGDDTDFVDASDNSMGLAIAHSRALQTNVVQLAVYDGDTARDGSAGTGADIARWRSMGYETISIPIPSATNPITLPDGSNPDRPGATENGRVQGAMLFCDFVGFSKLTEIQVPAFVNDVLGPVSDELEPYIVKESLLFKNTWGDGIFLVFSDIADAAKCALRVQSLMSKLPLDSLGLPNGLSLRIGAHCGPVFKLEDRITGDWGYFGSSVNRAARIEPVTPAEEVYVSEPFAAKLALTDSKLVCEYVGEISSAKNYGSFRMFVLRDPAG